MTTGYLSCGRKQISKDLADAGVLYDKFENKARLILMLQEAGKADKGYLRLGRGKNQDGKHRNNVFVKANIQIQDAMEDLKFTIYMS